MIETSRRSFITGLVSLVAAPAIVRVASIMPVKVFDDYRYEAFHSTFRWDPTPADTERRLFVRRFDVDVSEVYGRSPAMLVLPDLKFYMQSLGIDDPTA